MVRTLGAFLLALGATPCFAADIDAPHRYNPETISCAFVRASIRIVGMEMALQQARERGYSEQEIQSVITRCKLR